MAERKSERTGKPVLKWLKNKEFLIAAVLGVCVLVLYFSSFLPKKEKQETSESLEQRLSSILSEIDGAGKVEVFISFEGETRFEYATTKDVQSNTSSYGDKVTEVVSEKTSIVVVGGAPVILREISPKIVGVVVVAEGAGNVFVKLNIMKATAVALDVEPSIIEVFEKKQ